MAVDTKEKRLSMMTFGAGAIAHTLPEPDSSIDAADKAHLLGLYGGLAVSSFIWFDDGSPFYYNASDRPSNTRIYFEVYFRAASGTAQARLIELDTGNEVSNSRLTTTSASFQRKRTGDLAPGMTDGKEYLGQFGKSGSDQGGHKGWRLILKY